MKKKQALNRAIFMFAVVASMAGAFVGTAQAEERHGREWHDHERRGHERWEYGHHPGHRPYYLVEQPRVIYAPDIFVSPPPVFVTPPSSYNIVIPLTIR